MVLNLDPTFNPIQKEIISFKSFIFNGGEPHIRIDDFENKEEVYLTHRINSFNDFGLFLVAVDALKRMGVLNIHAFIPYFPGARQDRVAITGESLTVKVYADIINNLSIQSITILDPHSDVTTALLNNCNALQNLDFIKAIQSMLPKTFALISPDAGASKKIFKLGQQLELKNIIECRKKRDVESGALSGFMVSSDDLKGTDCLIVDDICDGGGTFLGIAEELKKKNAGRLFLAVSHGIFSKGFDLLSKKFDKIFTTNSIRNISHTNVVQIKLNDILN